jgi:hypothetical protein
MHSDDQLGHGSGHVYVWEIPDRQVRHWCECGMHVMLETGAFRIW